MRLFLIMTSQIFTTKQLMKIALHFRNSKTMDSWFCIIGAVTFASTAYVARYIMKEPASESRTPLSRAKAHNNVQKPRYREKWLDLWRDDVYPHDYVIINGKVGAPKF